MNTFYLYISLLLNIFYNSFLFSQQNPSTWEGIYFPIVQLDTVNITASAELTIQDLMNVIKKDNSLIKSFYDMRKYDFHSKNSIRVFDKKDRLVGEEEREMRHFFVDSLLYHETLNKKVNGNLYGKNGEANYSSLQIFNYTLQDDTTWINQGKRYRQEEEDRLKNMTEKEKRKYFKKQEKYQKKTFEFKIDSSDSDESRFKDLPFLDDKLAIFEPEMERKYNFKMHLGTSKYGEDSYIFLAIPKRPQKDETVIKRLEVCIKKGDLNILGYSLDLKYYSFLADFEILFDTNIQKVEEHYLPVDLFLDVKIDVIMMSEERFKWNANAYSFISNGQ